MSAVELSDVASGTPTLLHYFETALPVGAVIRGQIVDGVAVGAALGRFRDTAAS